MDRSAVATLLKCVPSIAISDFLQSCIRTVEASKHEHADLKNLRLCAVAVCEIGANEQDISSTERDSACDCLTGCIEHQLETPATSRDTLVLLTDLCLGWPLVGQKAAYSISSWLEKYSKALAQADEDRIENQLRVSELRNRLVLLRYFKWSNVDLQSSICASLFESLYSLVLQKCLGSVDNEIKQSLVAVMSHDKLQAFDFGAGGLWPRLTRLLDETGKQATVGMYLWLLAISLSNSTLLPSSLFQIQEYWQRLQAIVKSGSNEQRKTGLAILTATLARADSSIDLNVMKFDIAQRGLYLKQYEKFVTLFRTINIDRYLNQVQSSLSDLDQIISPSSNVHHAWMISLLGATFGKHMQDGGRRVVSTWMLARASHLFATPNVGAEDLLYSEYLPWSCQGLFFTTSVNPQRPQNQECLHALKLTNFLFEVITHADTKEHRDRTVCKILDSIVKPEKSVTASARVALMNAILMALDVSDICVPAEYRLHILDLFSHSWFLPIANDYMRTQCGELLERLKFIEQLDGIKLEDQKAIEHKLDIRMSSARQILKNIKNEQHVNLEATERPSHKILGLTLRNADDSSITGLCDHLRLTRSKCLHGEGLAAGLEFVAEALAYSNQQDINGDHLAQCLASLWDEIVAQDYPREALIRFCPVFLSTASAKLYQDFSELQSVMKDVFTQLVDFARYRMYVFVPIARALRSIMLHLPGTIDALLLEYCCTYAQYPPETKNEFNQEVWIAPQLQQYVPQRAYEDYYGERDFIGHASIFDALNVQISIEHSCTRAIEILEKLVTPWMRQKEPAVVFSPWKSTTQLQVILLLYEQAWPHFSAEDQARHFNIMLRLLSIELLPRFRYLMEWMLTRMSFKSKGFRETLLAQQAQFDASNPKLTVSIMKVAVSLAFADDADESYASDLATQLIVAAASAKIAIRHEAQWSVPQLWNLAEKRVWTKVLNESAFSLLNSEIRSLEVYRKPPAGRMLKCFRPQEDHNLTNLFEGDYLLLEPAEIPLIRREDFIALWEKDEAMGLNHGRTPLLSIGEKDAATTSQIMIASAKAADRISTAPSIETETRSQAPLQTKAIPLDEALSLSLDLKDSASGRSRPRDLIVVASLIDNTVNIGGLSRASEIFGCSEMYIANKRILKAIDFTSIAVSSQNWLPIHELRADNEEIKTFLTERKLQGYTVVGIEQTDSSQVLGRADTRLPEKLILVPGSETKGIPPEILGEMDFCVEIPQVGVTRSMNVQTAMATVLYEYARQHPG